MINITSFAVSKDQNSSIPSGNNSTGFASTQTVVAKTVNPVKIWGQVHDHTGDVNGDLIITGNIEQAGELHTDNVTTSELTSPHASIESIDSDLINTTTMNARFGEVTFLNASTVTTGTITADTGAITDLHTKTFGSDEAIIKNLTVTGQAHFFELVIDKIKAAGGAVLFTPADGFDVEQWGYVIVQEIHQWGTNEYVRASVFDNVPIPMGYFPVQRLNAPGNYTPTEFKYIMGNKPYSYRFYVRSIETNDVYLYNYISGDTCRLERQDESNYTYFSMNMRLPQIFSDEQYSANKKIVSTIRYGLYWSSTDKNGHDVANMWQRGDQAICRNFNQGYSGTNISNKYYWVVVTDASAMEITNLEGETKRWNYIEFDADPHDGIINIEVGDGIAMLGHRGDDDARKNAIYISAYTSLDRTLKAPLFAQYRDIDSFELEGKAVCYFSKDGNKLTGTTFITATGNTIEDDMDGLADQLNDAVDGMNDALEDMEGKMDSYKDHVDDLYNELTNQMNITTKTIVLPITETSKYNITYADFQDWVGGEMEYWCNTREFNDADGNVGVYCYISDMSTDRGAVTLYGRITWYETYDRWTHNGETKVRVYILTVMNASLDELYNKIANLEVTADNITMQVINLNEGLSTLTIDVNGIHTVTSSLDGRVGTLEASSTQLRSELSDIENNMTSLIQQKADEITLQVNETMMQITNQQVTINSDTVIEGDLTLNSENQGLTIVGPNGETAQIKPLGLGTYNTFKAKANSTKSLTMTKEQWSTTTPTTSAGGFRSYPYTAQSGLAPIISIQMGQYTAGKTISIKNLRISTGIYHPQYNGGSYPCESTGWANFNISKIVYWLHTQSGNTKYNERTVYPNSSNNYTIDIVVDNYSIPVDGLYYLHVEIFGTLDVYVHENDYSTSRLPATGYYRVVFSVNANLEQGTPAYMLITYDGIGVNFGGLKNGFIGPEGTFFKYGDYGLAITTTGIKKWNQSNQTWTNVSL